MNKREKIEWPDHRRTTLIEWLSDQALKYIQADSVNRKILEEYLTRIKMLASADDMFLFEHYKEVLGIGTKRRVPKGM